MAPLIGEGLRSVFLLADSINLPFSLIEKREEKMCVETWG